MANRKIFLRVLASLAGLALTASIAGAALVLYFLPQLPETDDIMQIQLSVPLRIYSANAELIAEYGEKRRQPISFDSAPPQLLQAIMAAEDDNFYHHSGVDFRGILRALLANLRSGEHGQGASTLTMQVARNYFLTREKTYTRKLKEVLLSFKLEKQLTKQQIFELYLNKIFLGHRAYGFAAAAEVYYGKPLGELDLAQLAMLAGLPKAPSTINPISNPDRALARRNYVLERMLKLDYLSPQQYQAAIAQPVTATRHFTNPDLQAPYIADMVRDFMVERFGEEQAYAGGYRAFTTVKADFQRAANEALFNGLVAYDERHGFRGAVGHATVDKSSDKNSLKSALSEYQPIGKLVPAIVIGAEENITAYTWHDDIVEIGQENFQWARRYQDADHRGPAPKVAGDVVKRGDIVYLRQVDGDNWRLSQLPEVEGALVSLDPHDGAILALSGGFNFFASKFNRATQARRQPGSNIKPFIYSAALEHGFTAASRISGAPVVIKDESLGQAWRPENYSKKFFGLTSMRDALKRSLNLVSVRLVRSIGVKATREYLQRFGFHANDLPNNLSLALGTAALLPIEVARAYSVFANGGFLVEPYLIARIEKDIDDVVYEAQPLTACRLCPTPETLLHAASTPDSEVATPVSSVRNEVAPNTTATPDRDTGMTEPEQPAHAPWAISRENAFIMTSLMQEVVRSGTARRARELGRTDLAGKTGTTNEQKDAWFSGFGPGVQTTVYIGFDDPAPLGRREVGGRAALPVWIDYMRVALAGVPEKLADLPQGIVPVYLDKETGKPTVESNPDAILEYFLAGSEPQSADMERALPFREQPQQDTLPEDIL